MLSSKLLRTRRLLRTNILKVRSNGNFLSTAPHSSVQTVDTNTSQDNSDTSPSASPTATDVLEVPDIIDARSKFKIHPDKLIITGKPVEEKIIYNTSVVPRSTLKGPFNTKISILSKREIQKRRQERDTLLYSSVDSLLIEKYLNPSQPDADSCPSEAEEDNSVQPHFPYATFVPVNQAHGSQSSPSPSSAPAEPAVSNGAIETWQFDYGTPDPNVRPSQVPCGGCGAYLHCQNPAIPGYMPSEFFHGRTANQLRKHLCQRCRFLREHDVALSVNISPEEYPKILAHIKDKHALVLLVVDLLDFPGSIWPDILSIIGQKRPVFVVGNKVDLIPQDGRRFMVRLKESLEVALQTTGLDKANIKGVSLVSAKTGYGIEELITKLQSTWVSKGDVYLMGCTNVGKSSIFNALLQSDFCKTQAIDLLERATVSPWPGTTLNLLKFPMLRPTGLRLYERVKRLKVQRNEKAVEEQFRKMQLRETKDPTYATLIGHIGRTFHVPKDPLTGQDPFFVRAEGIPRDPLGSVDPEDEDYRESKWCYDTPGTVQHDQILSLLTLEELMLVLPNKILQPRTLILKPEQSFFLAGLGRIDYLEGPHGVLLTVFASHALPLTIIPTENADELYEEALGTRLFQVPKGNAARLEAWPGLRGKEVEIKGSGEWNTSTVDLVLSSAGWVAMTAGGEDTLHRFFVSTPEGRGIFVRDPPLLPYAVRLRGTRNPNQSYGKSHVYIPR